MRTPGLLAAVVIMGLGNQALAAPSCEEQLAGLQKWLSVAKGDIERGAVASARVAQLVGLPLRKSTPPQQLAVTLVVNKAGVHYGNKAAQPVADTATLINTNANIAFARSNKNALAHGIVVSATADAPAAWVRTVAGAAAASGEPLWLEFRPTDVQLTAPPPSELSAQLDAIDETKLSAMLQIITREFGLCPDLMTMMRTLGGQSESTRLLTLVAAPVPALQKCQCKPAPDKVASILWKLALQNLGVLVALPTTSLATLPWGDGKGTWGEVAPAVVKAITR